MRLLPLFSAAAIFCGCLTAHADDPIISEFMADNSGAFADQDQQFSDWIEVFNPGPAAVNLQNWSLTDDVTNLVKWKFPSHTLSAGQTVVVFASAKNRATAGSQLHTNFELNDAGEYLALVKPDGVTKTSEWNPFPPQKENVSYGTAQQTVTVSHVDALEGKAFIPSGGSAPNPAWRTPAFTPDGSWLTTVAPPGLGYDTTASPPPASNIASTGTATQSTTNGVFSANLATDGVFTNYTLTASADAAAFWNLDFGSNAVINSITVNRRGDNLFGSRLRDITISILDATFTPVWTSELLNPENTGFVFPAGPASLTVDIVALNGGPVTGRHVRVSRTPDPDGSGAGGVPGSADEQNTLSMGEVGIIGFAPGAQINLARTGSPLPTASQTSTNGGFTASLGINGLNTDFTHTLNTDTAPAWTVNLNRRAAVHRILIHNRESACCPDRLRDITVQVLDADGTTVLHTSALLNPGNSLGSPADLNYELATVNGGNPVFGQYVRIKRTPDPSGIGDDERVLSLGEVQVRGTELNGYRPYIRSDIQIPMKDNSPTAYWRLPFSVTDASVLTSLSLRMRYDDGFLAWLNGTLIASRNAPASPDQNSTAPVDRTFNDGLLAETIDLASFIPSLTNGSGNVLAIHGLNSSAGDDNFLLQPELLSTTINSTPNVYLVNATPGTQNNSAWYFGEVRDTVFSHRRGFYDAAFDLAITSTTPGAQIYYTTNNSEPTLTNGTLYTVPISISGASGPTGPAGAKVVRARGFKTNWKSTNVDTHTYIFLNDVTSQPKGTMPVAGTTSTGVIPAGWPVAGSPATNGGQAFNYGFTTAVMAAFNAAQIREGLTQIPSLSIVTQQNNLTDPATGIYVNGILHGEVWERPASIEFLDINKPGATPEAGHGEFGENMGLRIRGGASRADNYTKHSFRVFFRNAYGNGKLNYRLFGSEGAAEYEIFDVRSDQNYAWSNGATSTEATLVRDPWSRDALGAMGQPHTRSRFAHLYLNGLYWGIYEIHERPENSYGQTYLGGDKGNYDVVKNHDRNSGVAFSTEATDGYLLTNPDGSRSAWKELWDRCLALPANPSNENYFRILGRNPDGTRNPAYPVLLDVDDLIDYMMAIFYTGDGDACLSGFLSFNQPNNWAGMRDRTGTRGFVFFNHDTEHTLRASSWVGSRGRVDAFGAPDHTGPYGGSNQTNFTYSNPQWMHEELMSSPEYRLRFADHARRHLFNNGALTPGLCSARWVAKTAPLTKAIVEHAGRWASAASVITTWTNLCVGPNGAGVIDNVPGDFFPTRHTDLLNMLKVDGLYPSLNAPDYSQHGGAVPDGYSLNITAPAGAQIYYTLDGSDPRAVGTVPTPLTYASRSAATRYYVTTAASGGDTGFSSVPVTPPSPGPVSRWPLDGTADDAVGTNHGTAVSTATLPGYGPDRNGIASSALVLNGTNQAVTLGNPANLQILGPITMAAWINPTNVTTLKNILNKGHNTTPSGEITLRVNAGPLLTGGSWNGADHLASFTGGATINTWQHVCSVYDGAAWRLYKNGVQVASLTDPIGAVSVAGAAAANNVWNIGSRGGSPTERAFGGSIDDVVIFPRGLTPNEVLALYNPNAVIITPDWKEPAWPVPASWDTAGGGIGYDTDATVSFAPYIVTNVQAAMQNVSPTVLTRKAFTLTAAQIADTGYLQLNIRHDDGFIAYLNGVKVAERNAPVSGISGTSVATAVRADADAILQEKINITAFKSNLVAGNNVLAVHGLNTTAADNDFLVEAELVAADNATVNAANVTGAAQLYTGPITLNSPVTVKARVFLNGTWSALTDAFFSVATEVASASNIVISELHYHPENPTLPAELAVSADKDEYEFIELMNISPSAIVDLTGIRFTGGITTTALGNQVLLPGERAVFVKNTAAFNVRYASLSPAPRILGTYTGNLNNQGEQVVLNNASGGVIRDFVYDDHAPWPEVPDGSGLSLTLINPLSNPDHSLATNWRGSTGTGGSPGTTSFAAWKAANGVSANDSDTDHDGLNALLEYFLNTAPGTPDNNLPVSGNSGGFLTFSLTHRNADDVVLVPEVSGELTGWSSAGITVLSSTANPNGTVTTVWKAPLSMAAAGRLFFRVEAQLQ